jgi:hypothetical protein
VLLPLALFVFVEFSFPCLGRLPGVPACTIRFFGRVTSAFLLLMRQNTDDKNKSTMLKVLSAVLLAVSLSWPYRIFWQFSNAAVKSFHERYYTFAEAAVTLIPMFFAVETYRRTQWSRLALIVVTLAWAVVIATIPAQCGRRLSRYCHTCVFVAADYGRFEKPKRLVVTMMILVAITLGGSNSISVWRVFVNVNKTG